MGEEQQQHTTTDETGLVTDAIKTDANSWRHDVLDIINEFSLAHSVDKGHLLSFLDRIVQIQAFVQWLTQLPPQQSKLIITVDDSDDSTRALARARRVIYMPSALKNNWPPSDIETRFQSPALVDSCPNEKEEGELSSTESDHYKSSERDIAKDRGNHDAMPERQFARPNDTRTRIRQPMRSHVQREGAAAPELEEVWEETCDGRQEEGHPRESRRLRSRRSTWRREQTETWRRLDEMRRREEERRRQEEEMYRREELRRRREELRRRREDFVRIGDPDDDSYHHRYPHRHHEKVTHSRRGYRDSSISRERNSEWENWSSEKDQAGRQRGCYDRGYEERESPSSYLKNPAVVTDSRMGSSGHNGSASKRIPSSLMPAWVKREMVDGVDTRQTKEEIKRELASRREKEAALSRRRLTISTDIVESRISQPNIRGRRR